MRYSIDAKWQLESDWHQLTIAGALIATVMCCDANRFEVWVIRGNSRRLELMPRRPKTLNDAKREAEFFLGMARKRRKRSTR